MDKDYKSSINIETFNIPYTEGKFLEGDLYIPKCRDRLPVVLMRTPYGKKNFYALFDAVKIAKMGFVVAIQNVRGRFESDGIFDPFVNERYDGELTIDWLKKQSWSNGNVFAVGVSYEGFTAMMCSNKNLLGVASIASSSKIREQWFFEGGAIRQAFIQAWAHSFAFTDKNRLSDEEKDYIQYLANDLTALYKMPLEKFPAGSYLPYYSAWIDSGKLDYWNYLDSATDINLDQTNGYYIGGWYDIFCEGTIRDYQNAVSKSNKAQRLVIGPWSHSDLFFPLVGQVDFGVYSLKDLDQYDIFNWFLAICNNELITSKVSVYIMGKNEWVHMEQWPPYSIKKRLYPSSKDGANSLNGDGILTWTEPTDYSVDQYLHSKSNPVPSVGGRCLDVSTSPTGKAGPFNQKAIEMRDDVLVYTSDYLEAEISIMGEVSAKLSVSSSATSANFHMKLIDVYPDGKAINILDSCQVIIGMKDEKHNIDLSLGNTAYSFLKGHRIRIEIASSCFPRININKYLLQEDSYQKVYLGNKQDTYIELPVI
jgi:putative CocE/NonD family hydrolase